MCAVGRIASVPSVSRHAEGEVEGLRVPRLVRRPSIRAVHVLAHWELLNSLANFWSIPPVARILYPCGLRLSGGHLVLRRRAVRVDQQIRCRWPVRKVDVRHERVADSLAMVVAVLRIQTEREHH